MYRAATRYFNFTVPASAYLVDGAAFVAQQTDLERMDSRTLPKWDFVIQDCFSGGSVPEELFTLEFWQELGEVTRSDSIVAMVSLSRSSRRAPS